MKVLDRVGPVLVNLKKSEMMLIECGKLGSWVARLNRNSSGQQPSELKMAQ